MSALRFADRFKSSTHLIPIKALPEIRRLRARAKSTPANATALEALCDALVRCGARAQAVRSARAFLEQSGDAQLEQVGTQFRRLGAAVLAEGCFARWHALEPDHPGPRVELGILHAVRGDLAAARAHLEAARELGVEQKPTARYAVLLERCGDKAAAEVVARRVLDRDPGDARAHAHLALLLDQEGDKDGAEHHLQRALQLCATDAEMHFNLGALYAESGRWDPAVARFQAGLELVPDSVEGHYNLGAVWMELGRHDAALAEFRRGLELQPGHADAQYLKGMCLLRKGQHEQAARCFEGLVRQSGPSPRLLYALGSCYNALEMPRRAAQALLQLVELSPGHARAYHLLGICWDKLGDRDRATAAYRRADACSARAARPPAARLGRVD